MDEEENNVIPIGKVSTKRSSTLKLASKKEAQNAAQMILSCYPDFGKAPPEYIVNLIDLLATYPNHILRQLVDLREGIVSQCSYLPALADIVRMAGRFEVIEEMFEAARERDNAARIAAEERANFMKAAEARLVEAKKKHPTAQLDAQGRIFFFPDLEKQKKIPTLVEVEQGAKVTQRDLLHQTRISKYDRLN